MRVLPRLNEKPRDNRILLSGRRFLILAAVVPEAGAPGSRM